MFVLVRSRRDTFLRVIFTFVACFIGRSGNDGVEALYLGAARDDYRFLGLFSVADACPRMKLKIFAKLTGHGMENLSIPGTGERSDAYFVINSSCFVFIGFLWEAKNIRGNSAIRERRGETKDNAYFG